MTEKATLPPDTPQHSTMGMRILVDDRRDQKRTPRIPSQSHQKNPEHQHVRR
jgi:hypothetical protein